MIVTYFGQCLWNYRLVGENIFTIGGLGQEFVTSIITVIIPSYGYYYFLAILLILLTLVSDLLYKVFDPRITFD